MKVPPHLLDEIVSALEAIFVAGRHADKVVATALKQHPKWGSRDRRMFAESAYDCVRWWRWYWHLAGLPDAEHADPEKITRLRIAAVWGACWASRGRALPEGMEDVDAGAIALRSGMAVSPAVRASIPDWLEDRGALELGAAWPGLRESLNSPAAVFLRVNFLKNDLAAARQRLLEEGFETQPVPDVPGALQLLNRGKVSAGRAFCEGCFEVQDAASQLIAPFLGAEPGDCVVDACAGGGGKTLHLAALMHNHGSIVAMDVHPWKLDELAKRAARAGAGIIKTRFLDEAAVDGLAGVADRVLLDVPCSGLGVLRRNPDTKWKMSDAGVDSLRQLQAGILESHSRMVRRGGRLVYATCSILPSENERQVARFLEQHPAEWALEEEMHRTPESGCFDGFYAARLVRRTSGR